MFALFSKIPQRIASTKAANIKSFTTQAITFAKFGRPSEVLSFQDVEIPDPEPGEVLLKHLAFPVNPSDINAIQGIYPRIPHKHQDIYIPGFEGVAAVVGTDERVFVTSGTWCTHSVAPASSLVPVPKHLSLINAATLLVNPCTAYRMLKDFPTGKTIVQNGSTSCVGQAVIQIASKLGLDTVNLVRDRDNWDETEECLKSLGATNVIRESKPILKERPKNALLGLNCIGGKSSRSVMNLLSPNATLVTYGGMSMEPIPVGAGPLIFKDLSLRGFWMTRWKEEHSREDLVRMIDQVAAFNLKEPQSSQLSCKDWKRAIEETGKGMDKKIVIME